MVGGSELVPSSSDLNDGTALSLGESGGTFERNRVGISLGCDDGVVLGKSDCLAVGVSEGVSDGFSDSSNEGVREGIDVGSIEGPLEGYAESLRVHK